MKSRIAKYLSLLLALCMVLSACSLVAVDPNADAKQAIIEIGGKTITKEEVLKVYEQQLSMYAQYGYDTSAVDLKKVVLEQTVNALVLEQVARAKAEELGFTTYTDEDRAKAKAEAQTTYDEVYAQQTETLKAAGKSDEDVKKEIQDMFTQYDFSLETLEEGALDNIWSTKIYDYTTADIKISDEEIKAEYDKRVESDKSTYAASPSAFETTKTYYPTTAVAYNPAGFRRVKHILIKFPTEIGDAITTANTELSKVETDIANFNQLVNPTATPAATVAPEATPTPEPTATPEATATVAPEATPVPTIDPSLETRKAELKTQIATLRTQGEAAINERVTAIVTKLTAGDDFDKLMAEFGEDDGMKEADRAAEGYYIYKDSAMMPEFLAASMALAAPGDVSAPVSTDYGVHIIKFIDNVPEGPVPMDAIKEDIVTALTESKKEAAYTAKLEEWKAATTYKTYIDRITVE